MDKEEPLSFSRQMYSFIDALQDSVKIDPLFITEVYFGLPSYNSDGTIQEMYFHMDNQNILSIDRGNKIVIPRPYFDQYETEMVDILWDFPRRKLARMFKRLDPYWKAINHTQEKFTFNFVKMRCLYALINEYKLPSTYISDLSGLQKEYLERFRLSDSSYTQEVIKRGVPLKFKE